MYILGSTLAKAYQVSGPTVVGYTIVCCMLTRARVFVCVIKLYVRLLHFNTLIVKCARVLFLY